jgi:hypothetical protein
MQSQSVMHDFGRPALACAIGALVLALPAYGGGSLSDARSERPNLPLAAVPQLPCSQEDHPETGLQGQVPAALRASGFKGFNCNLKLVGQLQGEGGNWSAAAFTDRRGRRCAYHATSFPFTSAGVAIPRVHPGVPVIDITDPETPIRVTSLTTNAMLDPWESLRANPGREILAADDGRNGSGNSEIDIYDISRCDSPQLLTDALVGTGADGGITPTIVPTGHEGNFSPDGLTYYVGTGSISGWYYAVDVSDLSRPKLIAQFNNANTQLGKNAADYAAAGTPVLLGGDSHGLSISEDGRRGYFVAVGGPPTLAALTDPTAANTDGFSIVDLSEVQDRKPNPQMRVIASVGIKTGSVAQHTIPITVRGRPYLVFVDEAGSGGLFSEAEAAAACAANLPVFPMAHIFDISDEQHPREISQLMLQTHLPENCAQVLPDLVGLATFTYGSHYCSVDNRTNATAMACGYFNSGIRVFDIRDPYRPKEIAYYNPAGVTTKMTGSGQVNSGQWIAGGPDWCSARLDFDFDRRMISSMCMDNGLLVLRFENGVWPMPESTPSRGPTN